MEQHDCLTHIQKHLSGNAPFVYADKTYSYQDLNRSCKFLQSVLQVKLVCKVLICLSQCFEAYASVMGSFLSGVTFCTISCKDPIWRKERYISQFMPDLIITAAGDSIVSTARRVRISTLDSREIADAAHVPDRAQEGYFAGQAIAYVMFTSGSTGEPKGVKIKRSALLHVADWLRRNFEVDSSDICSQYANMSFDMSLIDLFIAVTAGASLVPFPEFQDKLFPASKIKRYGITFWHSVPNVIDILKAQKQLTAGSLGTIRKCKFGGEQIFRSQMDSWFEAAAGSTAFLTYGTTEITFICSCLKTDKESYQSFSEKTMPLGDPIDGYHILLENVKDTVGELVVYGTHIGAGYLNTEMDSGKFTEIEINGEKLPAYCTGDLVRFVGGSLQYVERKDQQVKIHGNRIDLVEIDGAMRNMKYCACAHSLYHKGKIITVYQGEYREEKEIRVELARYLPGAYLPSSIIRRDDIPKNNSGKLDRAALLRELIVEGVV